MNTAPDWQEMLDAFLRSDQTYDGVFFTGVKTTGIFCRPSCTARKPLVKNVEFFPTTRLALFAGYRPCLRCRPLEDASAMPDWVVRLLQAVEESPEKRFKDADLRAMNVDPARARRHFLDRFGMTFHAYSRARRLGAAFTRIRQGASLDDAVFDSGYESHSGFRDAFTRTFGQTPGESRTGQCILATWIDTPMGPMAGGATENGVCLLEFTDRRMFERQIEIIKTRFRCPVVPGENPYTQQLRAELGEYFEGSRRTFTVPLDMRGTEFQERVWNLLLQIPYGETWSYEDLARRAGNPAAVRAVARANGMNRMAILIPCHRVVNKNGELGGYGGGLWRKSNLLKLEKQFSAGQVSSEACA
jgi:AraC family transcriptional regulator of adaptative response/methylated-DNA-[protein]-cysteine methyltransferase